MREGLGVLQDTNTRSTESSRRKKPKKSQRRHSSTPSVVVLERGVTVKVAMGSEPDKTFAITDKVAVHVVNHTGDMVDVVLPGYGIARVSQDDINHSDTPFGCGYRLPPLESLALNALKVDEDAGTNRLVGSFFSHLQLPSLQRLELRDNHLGSHALTAIVQACPNLKMLDVEGCELQSIAPILRAYTNGECRIESLNLADNHLGNPETVELCRLMSQQSSPANRMREINLEGNPISRSSLHALTVAMRSCAHLQLLVLGTSMDPDGTFRSMFYPFENQELAVEPLHVPQKLAFLSVLATRRGVEAMEMENVQCIFAFAASRRHRCIHWR
ncbi:hypothetical protein PINS_up017553 [Pythium insidiosum]|nr:hypothetical protein PINS_up017553 [Pythium insidiosum]